MEEYLKERKEELIKDFDVENKGKTTYEKFYSELFESIFVENYDKKLCEVNDYSKQLIAKIEEIDKTLKKLESINDDAFFENQNSIHDNFLDNM